MDGKYKVNGTWTSWSATKTEDMPYGNSLPKCATPVPITISIR